jgi:curved DNA-binding protein CbpA
MKHSTTFLLVVLLIILEFIYSENLYLLLGISKSASLKEIKRAYRNKARDTHPDKQKGIDPAVAAQKFHKIVEAYETLSDEKSRKIYDETGRTINSNSKQNYNNDNENKNSGGGWSWDWNFGFQQQQKRWNSHLNDPIRRMQILDAQSRVIKIRSILHLQHVITNDDSLDPDLTDRYTLLAFYDSKSSLCVDFMKFQLLYPWPFAGFSGEGSTKDGMWWEEIMIVGKVDIAVKSKATEDLLRFFGINSIDFEKNCPSIAFIPRGTNINLITNTKKQEEQQKQEKEQTNSFKAMYFPSSTKFQSWVWSQLKMQVTIINKTSWLLHQWWLDGLRGEKQNDVAIGGSTVIDTFISHTFFFRADFVIGKILSNEVCFFFFFINIFF